MVVGGEMELGATVRLTLNEDNEGLTLNTFREQAIAPSPNPRVLIVDDNRDLLLFLERLLQQAGWELLTALSATQAREIFTRQRPSMVLLDYMLGDDDGVRLALQFQTQAPQTQVIIMTGGQLPVEDETICQARDIPILRKPFLGNDVLALIRNRLTRASSAPRRTF